MEPWFLLPQCRPQSQKNKKNKGLPKVQTFGRGSKTRGHNFFLWSRINVDRTGVGVCVE